MDDDPDPLPEGVEPEQAEEERDEDPSRRGIQWIRLRVARFMIEISRPAADRARDQLSASV